MSTKVCEAKLAGVSSWKIRISTISRTHKESTFWNVWRRGLKWRCSSKLIPVITSETGSASYRWVPALGGREREFSEPGVGVSEIENRVRRLPNACDKDRNTRKLTWDEIHFPPVWCLPNPEARFLRGGGDFSSHRYLILTLSLKPFLPLWWFKSAWNWLFVNVWYSDLRHWIESQGSLLNGGYYVYMFT